MDVPVQRTTMAGRLSTRTRPPFCVSPKPEPLMTKCELRCVAEGATELIVAPAVSVP